MSPERYEPTLEEILAAETFLSPEEKQLSDEREAAIEASKPGELHPKLGSLLVPFDERLVHLDRLTELAQQEEFNRKPEFHITILGFSHGKEVLHRLAELPEGERAERLAAINDITNTTDWTPIGADQEILRIHKDYQVQEGDELKKVERRESLIQKIDLVGTEEFFSRLNALLGTNFEVPVTHVTLFTKSTNPKNATLGIGIKTNAEFDALEPTKVEY